MIVAISIVIILLISVILAVIESGRELSVPKELEGMKISKKNNISGVIIFLKNKVIHYSSHPSS
jgi:hypothetical protein